MSAAAEPTTKGHRITFFQPTQLSNESAWSIAAICEDCKRHIGMKFHSLDVAKMGRHNFSAIMERACRLTLEDTTCEPRTDPIERPGQ